jgi:hypothetical protein
LIDVLELSHEASTSNRCESAPADIASEPFFYPLPFAAKNTTEIAVKYVPGQYGSEDKKLHSSCKNSQKAEDETPSSLIFLKWIHMFSEALIEPISCGMVARPYWQITLDV